MPQFRSEWKYICSDGQLELVRQRLDGILSRDSHADADGSYTVHSLYFDDFKNSCAFGNDSGDGLRYKYRIRYYGNAADRLHLERKEKRCGLGGKKNCPLSAEEYASLVSGDCAGTFWNTEKPLLKHFCALIMTRGFAPKAVIDYERTAFTDPAAHIRVTLDRDITAAYDCGAFLNGDCLHFPLMKEHRNILEVKFDAIFPGWLRRMIESLDLQQTTFSKYYLGRKRLENILR